MAVATVLQAPAASPPSALSGLNDAQLAAALTSAVGAGGHVLFLVNKFTVAMFTAGSLTGPWALTQIGEFGALCATAAKTGIRDGRLFWVTTTKAKPENEPLPTGTPPMATAAGIRAWLKEANKASSGRTGDISRDVAQKVAMLAAHRCQFAGCGADLSTHAPTGSVGNFSYLAHIIAASPEGPRGDRVESSRLSNDPTNILLLCDACHRLVDRVRPSDFTAEALRQMRDQSIAEVARLLENLKHPEADALYIIGNVTGQVAHLSTRDIEGALWAAKLKLSNVPPQSYLTVGNLQHQPHEPGYWNSVFQALKFDIPALQARLNGARTGGAGRGRLAIFPLHSTSVLVLAGRLLGDMPNTHLFQPHRNVPIDARWKWPEGVVAPAANKFQVNALKDFSAGATEANFIASLTYAIDPQRLPAVSASNGALSLPTIEIAIADRSIEAIRHPDDLILFGSAVDAALRRFQDEWKVEKVHLYIGAPATAVLTIGQKMQARHHATYLCYEAVSSGGTQSQFAPTIEISNTAVRDVASGQSVSLQP